MIGLVITPKSNQHIIYKHKIRNFKFFIFKKSNQFSLFLKRVINLLNKGFNDVKKKNLIKI